MKQKYKVWVDDNVGISFCCATPRRLATNRGTAIRHSLMSQKTSVLMTRVFGCFRKGKEKEMSLQEITSHILLSFL
jgi:hypothetical protein